MSRNKFNIELSQVSKHINYKYGLVKESDQRVIYLSGKGWVRPLSIDETYPKRVELIQRRFNRLVGRYLANGELFSKKCISEFHIPTDNFQIDKKKFLQFECFFKQIKDLSVDDIKEDVEKGVRKLTKELEYVITNNNFQVTKRK